MRFAHNRWLTIPLGISSALISSVFIIAVASSMRVGATMPTCTSTPITKAHPIGGVSVNITITPMGNYDPLDITLNDDSGNVKQTVKSCYQPPTPGFLQSHTSSPARAFFPEVSEGKYTVCFKETCSDLFEKMNSSSGSATNVDLAVSGDVAPVTGSNVIVEVTISHSVSTNDTEYGGFPILLKALTSGATDVTEIAAKTTSKKGNAAPVQVKARFSNVASGLIKACIDSLGLCVNGEKIPNTDTTLKIDVPADKAKTLVSTTGSGGAQATCGSVVSGTGWFLCPIMTSLAGLSDLMWNLVQALLTINPLNQSDPLYQAWGAIRSIANVLFVIFFLIIIFSQLTSIGITNYGVKKLLPKIIVCAILVNVSFIFIQLAVDVSNIAGKGLYDAIMGLAGKMPTKANFGSLMTEAIAVSSGAAAFGVAAAMVGTGGAVMWLLAPSILMAVLALLAALVTLSLRQAAIPILAILAPLAFVAYLLPNTEQWFKKWKDLLVTMLMLYPLASLVFAGAQFAGMAIYASGDNFWWHMVGMVVMALPLFSLPFIARQGGAILTAANGALNKLAENARRPFTAYAGEKSQQLAKNRLANDSEMVTMPDGSQVRRSELRRDGTRRNRYSLARLQRNSAVDIQGRRERRKSDIDTDTSRFKSNWAESDRPQMGNGAEATQRAIHAKTRASTVADEAQTRFAETRTPIADGTSGVQEMDRQALAKDNARRVELAAGIRQSQNPTHRALKQENVRLEQGATHETRAIASEVSRTDEGRALDEQAAEDETIAATDKQRAAGRFASDPTTLDVRAERREADAYTKSVQDQEEQLITEASSGSDAGTARAMAAGMQMESITSLQAAKRSSDVAASATQSAKRAADTEYEKAIAQSYDVGGYVDADGNPLLDRAGNEIPIGLKEIPVTSTARAAAGIDNSTDRVQAIAQQSGDKRQGEESAAQQVLVEATTDIAGKIQTSAADLRNSLDPAQRNTYDGATNADSTTTILLQTGQKGLDELIKATATLPAGDISKSAEAIRSRVLKSGVKGRSSALDQYGIDPAHRSMAEILRDKETYQRLNIGQLASQGDYDLEAAFACGGINPTFATEIISNLKNFPDINGRKLEIFQAVAKLDGAPKGTPNPALSEDKSIDFVRRKLPPL